MPLLDDINRLLRDFTGYSGDGNGGQGALPVGDRSTARYPFNKRDMRELLYTIAQATGDPDALQDILDEVRGKATIANSGKIFNTRSGAVAAGQAALTPALAMIMTRSGDYMELRLPGATGDDPLFDTSPYWGVALRLPSSAIVDGKADIANSGKSFPSREAAEAEGQAALPAALGLIDTKENDYLVLRRPNSTEDALFPSPGPRWGVFARIPDLRAAASFGVQRLVITGGDGNHIQAALPLAHTPIRPDSRLEYVPVQANAAGEMTLTIEGLSTLGIYNPDGGPFPANYFKPGRPYTLSRSLLGNWRVAPGTVDDRDLAAALLATGKSFSSAAEAIAYGQENLPASLYRIYIESSGWLQVRRPNSTREALFETPPYWGISTLLSSSYVLNSAAIPRLVTQATSSGPYVATFSADDGRLGLSGTGVVHVEFIPNRNSPASPSIIVGDDQERQIRSSTGAALTQGALRSGKSYILVRRGVGETATWRLLFEDAPDLTGLNDRVDGLSIGMAAESASRVLADEALSAADLAETNARIAAVAALWNAVNAFEAGTRIVGDWDAGTGAFPAGASDGDQWNVSAPGVVDGVAWAPGDILTALVDSPSTSIYSGNWSRRVGTASLAGQMGTRDPGVTVQDVLDFSARVFSARADLLTANVPLSVDTLSWRHGSLSLEASRTDSLSLSCMVTADGAMWTPKGRPTPMHFGAVGDGVTDDTVAFQAFANYLKVSGREGWLPGGFSPLISSVNMWSATPISLRGDGDRVSIIRVLNPDPTSAGLRFTHPSNPAQRAAPPYVSDFALLSMSGNRAALYEHRYCSALKMRRLRFGTAGGGWDGADHQMLVVSKCWNVDISEVSVWRGGVNFPVFDVPESVLFSMSEGSDIISTDGGAAFFTADMVGKFLTLMADNGYQCFEIAAYVSPSQVRADARAVAPYSAVIGAFGGVRGTMAGGSNVLMLERARLTAADIGRRVYVHGADVNWDGRPYPLWARVTGVSGANVTLDRAAALDVSLTELIFDPAVDMGDESIPFDGLTNDLKIHDLHVEQNRGTALVISGSRVEGNAVKLHGNPRAEGGRNMNNIQMYAYAMYGHISGTFEQMAVGNRKGRILYTSINQPTSLGYVEAVMYEGAPTICLDLCRRGALVDVTGLRHIAPNTRQSLLAGALKVNGEGQVTCGFLGGYGQAPVRNIGFSAPTHTVASLPDPTLGPGPVFVGDALDGVVLAFSDGMYWRRVADRSIIS